MQTLFEHLRAIGEEKVRALREEAEAEVRRHAAEAEIILAAAENSCRLAVEAALDELGRELTREAEEKGRLWQARAEAELAARLYELAQGELPWLRSHGGENLLAGLAAELPREEWSLIRVNAEDTNTARALFPTARIEAGHDLTGGLIAVTGDNRITVDNSLETRLKRAWPRLLPELLQALERERKHAAV